MAASNSWRQFFIILGCGCISMTIFFTIQKFAFLPISESEWTIPLPKSAVHRTLGSDTISTLKLSTRANIVAPTALVTKIFLNSYGKYDITKNISTTTKELKMTPLVNLTASVSINNSDVSNRHIKPLINIFGMLFQGRLGNLLFEYASLYGIAKHLHAQYTVDAGNQLRKIFNMSAMTTSHFVNVKKYAEKRGCAFESNVFNIDMKYNWTFNGYFQSWKYFRDYEDEIRKELRFHNKIQGEASKQFTELIRTHNITNQSGTTFVAVHIRRGDIVTSQSLVQFGYTSADKEYIQRAMYYFQSNYLNVFFVISSDDISWCRNHINMPNTAFIAAKNPPEIDMAIMSHCNHTIITTGSYGWWTAWFINGTTIFYKKYPFKGSKLEKIFEYSDYWVPGWIPM